MNSTTVVDLTPLPSSVSAVLENYRAAHGGVDMLSFPGLTPLGALGATVELSQLRLGLQVRFAASSDRRAGSPGTARSTCAWTTAPSPLIERQAGVRWGALNVAITHVGMDFAVLTTCALVGMRNCESMTMRTGGMRCASSWS